MNKKLLLVPAVIAMALALPVQGHKTSGHVADDPDTLTVDTTYNVDPIGTALMRPLALTLTKVILLRSIQRTSALTMMPS